MRPMLFASASLLVIAAPLSTAFAQATQTVDEVVVTASRAATTGFTASTPTTVVGAEVLTRQAAPNISTVLNQIPAFKPSKNPGANATNTSSPAGAFADLRGLGAQRTLVLVNGMRVVPMSAAGTTGTTVTTDLNLIPSMLIERAEVVTGGASAQWGSDAVAGVVNIILKNKFEGLQVKAQLGQSAQNDYHNERYGVLAGRELFGGRGHIVGSLEYENQAALGDIYTRDWGQQEWQIVSNPNRLTNGLPAQILAPNVHSALAPGGLITGPANFSLNGFTFDPGGQTLHRFDAGSINNGTFMIGGEGQAIIKGVSLAPGVVRWSAYGRGEYELTDSITAFAELSFAKSKGSLKGLPPRQTNLTIRRENPFLPASVVAAMTAQNLQSFNINRIGYDLGNLHTVVYNETPHIALGLEGSFGKTWKWDASYSRGRNNFESYFYNNSITANYAFAIDAVRNPANGQIVCRATLPGATFNAAAAGCVPINLLGEGSPSTEAKAYVNGTSRNYSVYDQEVFAANLVGQPFSTWAGPVSIALGAEYRKESEEVTSDPIAARGGFSSAGNATPRSGEFDVKEGYIDAIVPLARDVAFAKSLDLSGAVRVAEYSTAGQYTTWKVGATWEPMQGLRFRVTQSKDIRAPALFELFSQGSIINNVAPVRGFSLIIPQNTTIGNPDLKAETGETFTAGVVLEPSFIPNLRMSLDYYDIELRDAVQNLSAANVGSLCTLGNQYYCSFFTFNPVTGAPTSLTAPAVNAASIRNRGYDFVLSHQVDLSDWFSGVPGKLSTSFNASYVLEALVDVGSGTVIDRVGEMTQPNLGAVPDLRWNLSETLTLGRTSLTAQVLYVSGGTLDNTYNTTPANTVNTNEVKSVYYLNLYGTWNLGENDRIQLYGAVENALDQDPRIAPYTVLNQPTNGFWYDKVGRQFRVGITYTF